MNGALFTRPSFASLTCTGTNLPFTTPPYLYAHHYSHMSRVLWSSSFTYSYVLPLRNAAPRLRRAPRRQPTCTGHITQLSLAAISRQAIFSEGAHFASLSGHRLPPPIVRLSAFFFSPCSHKSPPSNPFQFITHQPYSIRLLLHRKASNTKTATVNSLAVTLLGRSVLGLSPQKPWFNPRSVYVGFVVDEVALRRVLFLVLMVYPVTSNLYSTFSWVTQFSFCCGYLLAS